MRRRDFFAAAAAASIAGGRLAAQHPDVCKLPSYIPAKIDIAKASGLERATSFKYRPLWSKMDADARAMTNILLHTACSRLDKLNPTASPISMAAHAWTHRYFCCADCDPAGATYPVGVRNIHHTSDFLPWHRAFVYFHERAIRAVLGPLEHDFRLPVWDWEADGGTILPWIYEDMPFVSNPKYGAAHSRNRQISEVPTCLLQAWLQTDKPEDFIGPPYRACKPADCPPQGMSSLGPHSTIHTQLAGYMSQLDCAAIDPVFYSHHANVDRFWQFWQTQQKTAVTWPATSVYYFWDAFPDPRTPRLVRVTPKELLNPRDLGYDYRPPKLNLSEFTIPIIAQASGKLITFAGDGLKSLQDFLPQQAIEGLRLGRQLLGSAEDMAPAIVKFRAPKAESGKFYVLEAADAAGKDPFVIGGFGNFAGGDESERRFAVPLCLTVEKLRLLVGLVKNGGFSLFYKALPAVSPTETSTPVTPNDLVFEILLP